MPTNNTARHKVTPPELAARWGVAPEKILFWIRAGELRAIDASLLRGSKKPRFLIDESDIEAFEAARQVAAPLPTPRRRKKKTLPTGFIRHFRDSAQQRAVRAPPPLDPLHKDRD
jgi:hypothetical protein